MSPSKKMGSVHCVSLLISEVSNLDKRMNCVSEFVFLVCTPDDGLEFVCSGAGNLMSRFNSQWPDRSVLLFFFLVLKFYLFLF